MASKFLSPEAQFRAGVNNRDDAGDAPATSYAATVKAVDRRTGRGGAGAADAAPSQVGVRGDAEPGRRAAVLDLRVDHGAQRRLLQVQELRHDVGLRVGAARASCRVIAARG